jgi:hypothetical protein
MSATSEDHQQTAVAPDATTRPTCQCCVNDHPYRGVDAATAELRQRIQATNLLTRLAIALRFAR